ncbi:MAG TPA: ABC transporter permease [Aggregatilineales bacterium]|nr:ABC transporter permease [Aggregatilineales bacterium]
MSTFELLRLAIDALFHNRLRSFLTILGIVIGVGAVVALVSFGQSYQSYVDSQFQGLGASTLFIGSTNPNGRNSQLVTVKPLTMGDYEAIANPQEVSGLMAVAPSFNVSGTLVADNNSVSQEVNGTTDSYAVVQNKQVASGRFITADDVTTSNMVVVLGPATAQQLYPNTTNWVGQPVRINGQVFTIIGVMASTGGGFGFQDRAAMVPISTAQLRLGGASARAPDGEYVVSEIMARAASADQVASAQTDITALLDARHQIRYSGLEDFNVFTPGGILTNLNNVLSILTLFLSLIAGISLLVGGIGVMNIMLVSVRERTREIGLRKAVGARYTDLLSQFLFESITLSLIGGLLGIALGGGLAMIGGTLLPNVKMSISVPAIFIAVIVSSSIGLFFGLYPASRAAVLNPIEALRYE